MFCSLNGTWDWQPIAEGMDLLSGIYACTCTYLSLWISTNWHFAFFQEPVRSAGSSFLITPAIIYRCANGQQRPSSRKEGRM